MRVHTISYADISEICKSLYSSVTSKGFTPDIIIGVKSGGVEIARELYTHFEDKGCELAFCELERVSTKRKKSILRNYLKFLPAFFLNILRIFEAKFLFKRRNENEYGNIKFSRNVSLYKNILLVDDAIDTGITMKVIKEQLRNLNPTARILIAVVTVTSHKAILKADLAYFNDETLVRFPWSIDAK